MTGTRLVCLVPALLAACSAAPRPPQGDAPGDHIGEPGAVSLQHVLISFSDASGFRERGGPPPRAKSRSRNDAEQLAQEVLARARRGDDFGALVREFSDDEGDGRYVLVNRGEKARDGEWARNKMVEGFGDVGFKLGVGETGLATYHIRKSPFGWHVIKRTA